jgi:dipeptidyl aminopeptidase/acylaminoacyl peptidase
MKNIIISRLRLSGLLLILLMGYAIGASAAPLTYEDFGHLPDVSNLKLSPDGKKLASIIRVDMPSAKGSAVQVTQLSDGTSKMVLFSDNSKYFINWVQWKDSKTLLVNTFYPSERDTWMGWYQLRGKTREGRLLIVNTETGAVISPFRKIFLKKFKVLPPGLNTIVDVLPQDPDHILMEVPSLNNGFPSFPLVYKVNIKTSKNKRVQQPKLYVSEWMTDQQQRVRVGIYYKDGEARTLVREVDADKWRELWPYQLFSEDQVSPVGFGLDPNVLYIRAYKNGFLALFKVNLTDAALTRELVYADEKYDVTGGLIYSPITHDVVGITYGEEGGTKFFEPSLQKLQDSINKALPKSKNYLYSFTDDFQKYLVFTISDRDSGSYYIGQRSPVKLAAAAYRYKKLVPELMVPVQRYDYTARDGLNIEAYLSLPRSVAAKKLPAIMFPHGGPIGRDDDSFDYWAQYFANKGYAVLQMNFRGSGGQGIEFRNAGLKNWGKEMQDDIEDGAKKLIADGIIDPERVCIVGASYGGYAALMGVVKTPDVYKCAVSVAGVSNVFDLVKDNRAFWRSYNVVDEQIGNDNTELRAASPVNFADKIKVPVLLVHGDMDRQVDIKHSVQMHDALQKGSLPY